MTIVFVISQRVMGKSIDIAIDALKICGYCAIGGGCFYVLSGGKLPSRGTLPFQVRFFHLLADYCYE